jgi:hypothetical protein
MGLLKSIFKAFLYIWLIGFAFFGYRFATWLYGAEDPLPFDRLSTNTEPSKADLEVLALLSEVSRSRRARNANGNSCGYFNDRILI